MQVRDRKIVAACQNDVLYHVFFIRHMQFFCKGQDAVLIARIRFCLLLDSFNILWFGEKVSQSLLRDPAYPTSTEEAVQICKSYKLKANIKIPNTKVKKLSVMALVSASPRLRGI